jgi:hypothetical protein
MLRGAACSGRRCGPAPGAPVSKPPTQTLRPPLHVDQDEIYSVTLGPTLAQILEKHAQGTLIGGDVAGYLAVEKGLAEMREETWLSIPFETVTLIAESLVGPAVWGKLEAAKQAEAVRPRDEKLQDRANERYSPEVEATEIAEIFLADPALRSLLVLKNADGDDKLMKDGKTPRLMKVDTLRKIIAKRHERRK